MGFEIEGIDKLMSALTTMSNPDFADQALMQGMRLGGKMVQGTAKQICPVGDPAVDPNSGNLRNSIEVTDIANGVEIGTNVEYAPYVEFGTGQRGDPSVPHREDWVGQSPQPYLYPALKANEENIQKIVKDTLQTKINKVVGK